VPSHLSDFCRITMGQSPKGDECNSSGVGSPLLNGPTEFQLIHPLPVQWTTNPKKFSKSGDLLFCVRGSAGRMNWSDQEYAIGRGLASISPLHEGTMHFFRGAVEAHLPSLLAGATGSTFPNVSRGDLESIPIPYPDLSYIRNASSILKALERKIELNQKMNKTLEEIAKAIFKSWFVDFDPVRAKAEGRPTGLPPEISDLFPDELVDSEIGEIPRGWSITPLPDAMDFLEGPGIRNWQYTNDESGIRFINIRCIKDGDLNLESANRITEEEALGKYAHFALEEDDIVVSTSGTLGRHAFVRSTHLPLNLNTSVIRFRPVRDKSTLHFLSGFVQTQLQWELETRASGSVQRNFGPMHLKQIELLMPPFPLLSAHQNLVEPFFRKRQTNLHEIEVLSELRDTLLPKLISGELRIPDAEKFLEEAGI
jgi:type I restriction enzyme S subunit